MSKCAQIWEHMVYAKSKQWQRHDITKQRDKQRGKTCERLNKHQRILKVQSQMDNPEKLAA